MVELDVLMKGSVQLLQAFAAVESAPQHCDHIKVILLMQY
jgi:hypothetical protein